MRKKYVKIALLICVFALFAAGALRINENIPLSAPAGAERKRFYTFLVCGLDKASENTDVMMLASLDTENGELGILQVPRDTFLNPESSGLGVTRVNAAYAALYAGAESRGAAREKEAMAKLCALIGEALCVEIDRFLLMDTAVFASAVDAVGGIEYNVPFDMDYDDPAQDLHIHLKAGAQTLDGKKAEQFIRYRAGYATGDIGRVEARESFLREALLQVKAKLSAAAAVKTVISLMPSVTTNVSVAEAAFFAAKLHSAGEESFKIKTISGSAVQNPKTGAWTYYALNKAAALCDINAYMRAQEGGAEYACFDKNAIFTDDPNGQNPYISKYYYSKIKTE